MYNVKTKQNKADVVKVNGFQRPALFYVMLARATAKYKAKFHKWREKVSGLL